MAARRPGGSHWWSTRSSRAGWPRPSTGILARMSIPSSWRAGGDSGRAAAWPSPGPDLVYKPRDVWHTFWNAADEPGRLLEIISPAGFERFFADLAAQIATGPVD